MPAGSFGCGRRSERLGRARRRPARSAPLVPGLGFVLGEVGRELADEELLKEVSDGAAGDAEGGVFDG